MVQINRSNVRTRLRGPGQGSLLGRLHSFADSVPYLSRLSDVDRMLLLTGAALLGVVSFSYVFLLSGILGPIDPSGGGSDPRLSTALRKTGLSEEALLQRGGGKRISVGPKPLDASENAAALDIIDVLKCDALQEEIERRWHAVLDKRKAEAEKDAKWELDKQKFWDADAGGSGDFVGDFGGSGDFDGGASGDGGDFPGAFDGRTDDHWNRRRLQMEDNAFGGNYGEYGNSEPDNQGLKLTARHLFCLAAEGLALPKSTTSSPDPSTHCDVNSFELRERLLGLWSSARSQMPEDVITKTLRLVTEHKEDLRGNEVHLWYPDGDKGTEGMLRVLNSAYDGRQTYNFDSELADSDHDDLYRFHDREFLFDTLQIYCHTAQATSIWTQCSDVSRDVIILTLPWEIPFLRKWWDWRFSKVGLLASPRARPQNGDRVQPLVVPLK